MLFVLCIMLIVFVVDFVGSTVALLSGPSASTSRLFSVLSGELVVLEKRPHIPTEGLLHEPHTSAPLRRLLDVHQKRANRKRKGRSKDSMVVLTHGHTARMLDMKGREAGDGALWNLVRLVSYI
jgi:hypothetical protein